MVKKQKIDKTADFFEENEAAPEDKATVNAVETKFMLAKKLIANIKDGLIQLENIFSSDAEPADLELLLKRHQTSQGEFVGPAGDNRIVEGVFDGQNMVGSDGRQYLVPQNYASKSKLVEGDILKLTIQPTGGFLFKQIGPIERDRLVGMLVRDEVGQGWKVVAEGKKYNVIQASVSYFKGEAGDDVVILIPKAAPSRWAAVENIIKKSQ